ncbi:MAG: hypothetical protein A2289_12165 [Deltaproteobacteria bacterium RIFOXYA12_FULL_58_15]|nr:MAG: hypothetical protein A2289_12165 [Deltaproteobacteria bacterium RIFOXYA12_FULL_58_15]OGR11901.1 MAG: hypothetical protein A2341_15245 [Deltaproteobacteria bacterium RIFOXYB12_FULL_58_9]
MVRVLILLVVFPRLSLAQEASDEVHTSDAAASPKAQAPIGDMTFSKGRWTLTPALGLVQINTTTGPETDAVRLPAVGFGATYTFDERWAAFASAYGTRLNADVDGNRLSGELTLGLGLGAFGAAFNIYGCNQQDAFRAVAAAGVMLGRLTADLSVGRTGGALRSTTQLYRLNMAAAIAAVQAEWRPWSYLSLVPHVSGWRLLAVKQTVGDSERDFPVSNRWRGSTGLDVWIYPIPATDSHLSLGMILALGGDKPISTFMLSWTFVFGDDTNEEETEEMPNSEGATSPELDGS